MPPADDTGAGHSVLRSIQTPGLGVTTRPAQREVPVVRRLEIEVFDPSPARKRRAVEMEFAEGVEHIRQSENSLEAEVWSREREKIAGNQEVGQFLESLGKELEGPLGCGDCPC